MIQKERIKILNDNRLRDGKFVLYWMQQAQRTEFNHALEYAIEQANLLKKPLIVFFQISVNFPEANARHYWFMLEGLREVQISLAKRKIAFVITFVSPEAEILKMAANAALVVVDRGYLKIQREWRRVVAEKIVCRFVEIESDVIVPIETASPKEEYAAATLRPKIARQLDSFLVPIQEQAVAIPSSNIIFQSLNPAIPEHLMSQLTIDRSLPKSNYFTGGTANAKKLLQHFVDQKLARYNDLRNDPTKDNLSQLSPYLHFGQISPLYIALKVLVANSPGSEPFLEELIVRRELSMNFSFYNPDYDNFACLPDWAKLTLQEHECDAREHIYPLEVFENADTHDPYWNAAQKEMTITGKMHGYMRMYWGKKIIEWTKSPEEAYQIALYLNNKYELDGRDPNGFAGVAWCFGKHDRAWAERPIFGKARCMNANGLRRKFDADGYVKKVAQLGM